MKKKIKKYYPGGPIDPNDPLGLKSKVVSMPNPNADAPWFQNPSGDINFKPGEFNQGPNHVTMDQLFTTPPVITPENQSNLSLDKKYASVPDTQSWFQKRKDNIEMASGLFFTGLNKVLGDADTKKRQANNYRRLMDMTIFRPETNPYSQGNGSQAIMKDGGNIKKGSKTKVLWGGKSNQISDTTTNNPMVEYTGQTHKESTDGFSGIGIQHGVNKAEVQDGEVGWTDNTDVHHIFGDMNVPTPLKEILGAKGNKYKSVAKDLANQETKIDKDKSKAAFNVTMLDETDPYLLPSFNTNKVMLQSKIKQAEQMVNKKQTLASFQSLMLAQKDAEEVTAKYGAEIPKAPGGTKLNGKVDARLQKLYDMINKKYDISLNSDLRPGDKKRHGKGEAFDLGFTKLGDKSYQTILEDKDIVKYMSDNGITAINEYDPTIRKLTKGTGPHIHFGFDKGTKLADQFRLDTNLKDGNNFTNFFAGNKNFQRNDKTGLPEMTKAYSSMYDNILNGSNIQAALPNFGDSTPNKARTEDGAIASKYNDGGKRLDSNENPNDKVGLSNTTDIKSYNSKLDLRQIAPELLSIANSNRDPVNAPLYKPALEQTFDISYQLGRNENQASFNSMQKIAEQSGNTAALYDLAAQKYKADQALNTAEVQGNATQKLGVYNRNTDTLNKAQAVNLQKIMDGQQDKIMQGKAVQNAQLIKSFGSIAQKSLQSDLEGKMYNAYHSLFPDYGFDNKGNVTFDRTQAISWKPGSGDASAFLTSQGKTVPDKTITRVDNDGNESTTQINNSDVKDILEAQAAIKKGAKKEDIYQAMPHLRKYTLTD